MESKLNSLPDVLTVLQLSRFLGIGKNSAYDLVRRGEIGSRKVGRKYLIPKRCVVDYLKVPRYNENL